VIEAIAIVEQKRFSRATVALCFLYSANAADSPMLTRFAPRSKNSESRICSECACWTCRDLRSDQQWA